MGEMGRDFDGLYAEYDLLSNELIYPISTQLDWATLATIPETYFTAFGAYQNLKITSHDTVLVRAGASGVGTAFVKLVKAKFPDVNIMQVCAILLKKRNFWTLDMMIWLLMIMVC